MIAGRRARILLAVVLINMILASMTLGFATGNTSRQVPTNTPTATRDPSACLPVEEAVGQGLVRVELFATGLLVHDHVLSVTVYNLTSEPIMVCFQAGMIATPIDPQYRRATTNYTTTFNLGPGESASDTIANYFIEGRRPPAGAEYRLEGVPTATLSGESCLRAEDALSQGMIRLTLVANGNLFFRDPLDYRIENLTDETYTLCFSAGLIAYPVDPQYQRLMLTAGYVFIMTPGAIEEGAFAANCINEDLHPPEAGVEYRLATMADGDLLGVAEAIDDREAQMRLGAQMATWAVTDAFTLDDMADAGGSGLTSAIQPLLCLTTGEVELAQQLLEDAGTDLQIYTSDNPADFCQDQGIPSLEQVQQLGSQALRWILIGLAACVALGGGGLFLLIRALRARPRV